MPEKRERIRAVLSGQETDRVLVTMWRHFYDRESTAEGLAESMLWFQRQYDWDLMKVNPRAQYHVEDWGATFQYGDDPHTGPTLTHAPVSSADDWDALDVLDPHRGTLGEQLHALRMIREGLQGAVPFIMTVFNPISIAGRMVTSDQVMVQFLREHPGKVHAALEAITETYRRFITECLDQGVDGIFFATTAWASHDLLTDEEYAEFGRPYDLRVLDAARDANVNILHVCRSNNMLEALADYPVHAFNWDNRDSTNPRLGDARGFIDKTVVGGVDRYIMRRSSPAEAAAEEVRDALEQTGGRGFILGPTCSISPRTPHETLMAVKEAALRPK